MGCSAPQGGRITVLQYLCKYYLKYQDNFSLAGSLREGACPRIKLK